MKIQREREKRRGKKGGMLKSYEFHFARPL